MAFSTFLQAAFGKSPLWLYEITLGSVTKRYVHGPSNVTFESQLYEATSGFHSRPQITTDVKRNETKLTFPRTNTFAQSFMTSGSEDNSVTIRRYFREDTDAEAVYAFRGRVVSAAQGLVSIVLTCESTLTLLRRRAGTPVIQKPCRHALYGRGCNLDRSTFETSLTATAWTAPILTVTGADSNGDGYYTGGVIRFDGNLRWISDQTGTAITLDQPVNGLEQEIDDIGTATVFLAPGCNRSRAICNARFSNIDNFGGFDWMNGEDPYDGRNIYG